MGLRFRKSIKVAPGVRINFNAKSASISVGGKGARCSYSTNGRKTTTCSIPGTGISYVKSTSINNNGNANHSNMANDQVSSTGASNSYQPSNNNGQKPPSNFIAWVAFVFIALATLGAAMDGKYAGAFLMLLSALFCLPPLWKKIQDTVVIRRRVRIFAVIALLLFGGMLISNNRRTSDADKYLNANADTTAIPSTPRPTIEPTSDPTVAPTPEPTIESTPEPTIAPTPEPTPVPTQTPILASEELTDDTDMGTQVYISQTGSKYHSKSSCSNMKNPRKVSKSEAQSMGLQPCKKCH